MEITYCRVPELSGDFGDARSYGSNSGWFRRFREGCCGERSASVFCGASGTGVFEASGERCASSEEFGCKGDAETKDVSAMGGASGRDCGRAFGLGWD